MYCRLLETSCECLADVSTASGNLAAEWVKDEQSTMCAECCAEFTVLNRRHHCRACGKVFCGSCSDYRAPIAFLGGKLQRVCTVDYYLINNELKPPTPAIMEGMLRRSQKVPTKLSRSILSSYLAPTC
ncbi:unnamed protein product [Dicrocoelium dendriticum]|nr:unnamed protein product [Dicrocoelium dendriticum]